MSIYLALSFSLCLSIYLYSHLYLSISSMNSYVVLWHYYVCSCMWCWLSFCRHQPERLSTIPSIFPTANERQRLNSHSSPRRCSRYCRHHHHYSIHLISIYLIYLFIHSSDIYCVLLCLFDWVLMMIMCSITYWRNVSLSYWRTQWGTFSPDPSPTPIHLPTHSDSLSPSHPFQSICFFRLLIDISLTKLIDLCWFWLDSGDWDANMWSLQYLVEKHYNNDLQVLRLPVISSLHLSSCLLSLSLIPIYQSHPSLSVSRSTLFLHCTRLLIHSFIYSVSQSVIVIVNVLSFFLDFWLMVWY